MKKNRGITFFLFIFLFQGCLNILSREAVLPENIKKAYWVNSKDMIIIAAGYPHSMEEHPVRRLNQARNQALLAAQAYMLSYFSGKGKKSPVISTSVDKEILDRDTGNCVIHYRVHTEGRYR